MEIVQANINHCESAQDLLWQAIAEEQGDDALISEPYRTPRDNSCCVTDWTGLAAIWAVGRFPIQKVVSHDSEGFTIAIVNGVYFSSCYASPSWELERFNTMLDNLFDDLLGCNPVVVAGDFNAWVVEWGSRSTNSRGEAVLESLSQLNVVLGNVAQCCHDT
uniref:Endo/exonuclease/phosphatase domain-containing protein n=1 Tax=Anopheles stephensi TaxID=30069 RepID=A0A182YT88_ANOST